MTLFTEVMLAAWLWDVDKLYTYPAAQLVAKYEKLFARYADCEVLLGILMKEQAQQQAVKLIEQARFLSLQESAGTGEPVGGLLCSVFSRLSTGENMKPPVRRYTVSPLQVDALFPREQAEQADYTDLGRGFERELARVAALPPDTFPGFITMLDTLLKKYCWCIPATGQQEEDISLYDHMRITAAVTACLLHSGLDTDQPFTMVAGDFSGIQSYIFQAAKTGNKGVAKRLRARSFYVDAAVTVLAHSVMDVLNMPLENILMLTGGKFYLLLPHTLRTEELLSEIQRQSEAAFFAAFKGELAVNLAWTHFGKEGLVDYSRTVTALSRKLSEQKNQPFHTVLQQEGNWNEKAFVIYDDLRHKTLCEACGKALIEEMSDGRLCNTCAVHTDIGGRLPKAEYLVYSRDGGQYALYRNYYLSLLRADQLPLFLKKHQPYRVEQLNNWEIAAELTGLPLAIRPMANHLPAGDDGEVLTFSDLAGKAAGSKKLGILKADVDRLGYLFADGLRDGERHYGTISRINTMSRMLELFFSGYVQKLIETRYPMVYSVFSGGDDLFVLGPWDVLPEFILELESAFKEFAAQNSCVTLSAAIIISNPKTHIAALADNCEKKLKTVKTVEQPLLYPGKQGRNGVYFMENIFSWEDFQVQLRNGLLLAGQAAALPRAVLRRMGQYSGMYRKFLETRDVFHLSFAPLFYYDRKRNYEKIYSKRHAWFLEYAGRLTDNAANYKALKKDLFFAGMVVRFALSKSREEREHGI